MIFRRSKSVLQRVMKHVSGWRTGRKFLVIESDDWGSIRMPDADTYRGLLKSNIPVDRSAYCRYDCLESEVDLAELFNVLADIRNAEGRNPVITANFIVANPDFGKIRESGYTRYFYEPFTETYMRYPKHNRSFSFVRKGIEEGFFLPQFHGREHVNVALWLEALANKNEQVLAGFHRHFYGFDWPNITASKFGFMAALDGVGPKHTPFHQEALEEGVDLFAEIFHYSPQSFIAPCYIWNSDHERLLRRKRIEVMQGIPVQYLSSKFAGSAETKYHYLGERNSAGLFYNIRNCFFEPSLQQETDAIRSCLRRISVAFAFRRPAVVASHRVNFIGSIDKRNRERNLASLRTLLTIVVKKWPEVEFITTPGLFRLIKEDGEE